MNHRLPDHIAGIAPYVPGRPEESLGKIAGGGHPVKLASNENPLGPSPRALEAAFSALRRSHRYPDGSGHLLREALAERHRLPASQILLGNGSTELVELVARTFLGRDGWAVMAGQAFVMYRIAVLAVNGRAREVPLNGMRHDLEAMAAACGPQTVLVYIANPNNPTGTYVTAEQMERYFQRLPTGAITVLDEAYAEYIDRPDYPSGLDLLRHGKRIVVLRTFSKIYGLAGLRIGYCAAPADLVDGMERVRSPFNTSRVSQAAALAALEDRDHLERSRTENRAGMARLEEGLRRRGLRFVPSVANFVLMDVGREAEGVHQALLRQGVIVRPMASYRFPTSLRVTIGTEPQMELFLRALDCVLA